MQVYRIIMWILTNSEKQHNGELLTINQVYIEIEQSLTGNCLHSLVIQKIIII